MAISQIPMWKENENWRARQQSMRDYMDTLSALTDNLTGAGGTQSEGTATLVTQAAIKRMKAEAAAKNAKTSAETAQQNADDKALQAVKDRMYDYTKVNVVV